MNSNCRQTLAALLEGKKERISQSIYTNKGIKIFDLSYCLNAYMNKKKTNKILKLNMNVTNENGNFPEW
jgi:hypothetical protein